MRNEAKNRTVELGDLVVAVYDAAALVSSDPRQISRLAKATVRRMLRHQRVRWIRGHRRPGVLRLVRPDEGVAS